jgi:hypothetical protein
MEVNTRAPRYRWGFFYPFQIIDNTLRILRRKAGLIFGSSYYIANYITLSRKDCLGSKKTISLITLIAETWKDAGQIVVRYIFFHMKHNKGQVYHVDNCKTGLVP